MSYFGTFASFKDCVGLSKSFVIRVVDIDDKVYISSGIPMELLDVVVVEVETAIAEGISFAIWDNIGKKLTSFVGGTIRRYEIIMS